MLVDQSVGATFVQDSRDPDQDGLSNYEELLVFGTDPTDSDSDDDGYIDGLEQSEGSDPKEAASYPKRTLTLLDLENGSLTGAGVYPLSTEVNLVALPALGYLFTGWAGDVTGTTNPLTFVLTENPAVGANFERDLRDQDGDGLSNYDELALIGTDPTDWDSDNDGYSDGEEQSEGTDPNESSSLPRRTLTVNDSANGSVTGGGTYPLGATTTLEALPDQGYLFGGWIGEVIGEDNPLSITMLVDQSVGATFVQDSRDPDQDGLSNYEELLVFGTDPADADSDGDGYIDGLEQSEGSDPNDAGSYPAFTLTLIESENGFLIGGGVYRLGASAVVAASPNRGFVLSGWTGDSVGRQNPLSVTMSKNQVIGAIFERDLRDSDGDGLSNYDELIILGTNPENSDSDSDGFNDGFELTNNTDAKSSASTPPMGLEMSVSKVNDFLIGVFSVTPPIGGGLVIEESQDLKNWIQVESFSGDGKPFSRTILPEKKGSYYRLRLIDQSP
jgi:hypothetical protein